MASVAHSPPERGSPASQSLNISQGLVDFHAIELPKPPNYADYEIFDGRNANHPTKSFDKTWKVDKLTDYIQKARKNVMEGYGNKNEKTLLYKSGIYHYEIIKFDNGGD